MHKKSEINAIPFREAVRSLEKEGLILSRPGRGSWVAGLSHILNPLIEGAYEEAKLTIKKHLQELKNHILDRVEFSE